MAIPQSVSLVIPAYNEESRLPDVLRASYQYLSEHCSDFEIIVVDDGSVDSTAHLVQNFAHKHSEVRCIQLENNSGKGAAVRAGMLQASKLFRLFADADGSTPLSELERLYDAIQREKADVAIGSRALRSEKTHVHTQIGRKLLGRLFNRAINFMVLPDIADTQCGFKVFSKKASEMIFPLTKIDGFSFDIELLFLAKQLELNIVEVPVNWRHVSGSKVRVFRDGIQMFLTSLRIRSMHSQVKVQV